MRECVSFCRLFFPEVSRRCLCLRVAFSLCFLCVRASGLARSHTCLQAALTPRDSSYNTTTTTRVRVYACVCVICSTFLRVCWSHTRHARMHTYVPAWVCVYAYTKHTYIRMYACVSAGATQDNTTTTTRVRISVGVYACVVWCVCVCARAREFVCVCVLLCRCACICSVCSRVRKQDSTSPPRSYVQATPE